MMKRILLIVSLGVSFVAPAAFGSTAKQQKVFRNYEPCKAETGMMTSCQEDIALSKGAGDCNKLAAYKAQVLDNLAHGFTASGARPSKHESENKD